MKKLITFLFCLVLGISAIAQQKIQLRSADRAECTKSDMTGLQASFSFSSLDATEIETSRGEFSEIHIDGSYPNGNVGEPQLPMFTRLIAIPTGATPVVTVDSYSEKEYTLSEYGIGKVAAMQAPVRKNIDPSTVEYAYSEAAYSRDSYNDDPIAMVEELGTMRGITLGRIIVQPVRYNPAAGTVKVYNDIEVSVRFPGGDAVSTEQMFKSTCSHAFQSVYDQIFNINMLMGDSRDAYTDHPDKYNTPVKMLVICYSGFQGNAALNSWLEWKLQKGYYVDIYYTGSGSNNAGTTSSAIASFIKTKYNASVSAGNAYTYLVVIGDTGQVPQYMSKTIDSDIGSCASDLGYASVNFSSSTSNYFPDMYYSRISVENTTHLTNYINKVLTYEKYEFTDGGNYLNNVILVGGWDSNWTPKVAKPTINYGTNYYFKSSNTTYGGFGSGTIKATVSTSSSQGYSGSNNGVYQGINNGACFVNYTAHGDKQEWTQPLMTAAQVATLSNTGKYFFGVGNCCLTGNFNSTMTTYSPGSAIGTNACFAETMIRVPNAGAVAYLGCSPYSYWYEDFYWAVGAHSYSAGNYPTNTASSKGVYDVMFQDQYWNSASALLYLGNLAVQQAVTNGNQTSSITDGDTRNSAHYYFQFYHTFGDGSVMPYITKPETNTVTIPSTVTPGTTSITVNAVAGSYVAVTDNSSVIYGVAEANSNGVATVNFTNAIPSSGDLHVVVTRQQYQPYFGTITVQGGTQYTITANVNNAAWGSVTGGGQLYEGATCTLTATANHGYAFEKWSDNNTDNPRSFTVTGNATYTANFRQLTQHHCTYTAQQTNGTIGVSPANAYAGDIVTLTATPAAGYCLDHWDVNTVGGKMKGNVPVVNNQFTMPDAEVTISATFKSGYTVSIADVANGTITATPTSALAGETITLTATPNTGCEFSTWYVYKTGDPTTLVAVVNNSFSMPSYDVTVSAVFATTSSGDVTIGSGTSTTNGQYLPSYTYYNYSLTQQIYTVAEVGEAGTITAIAFQVSNSKAATRSLDIYMVPTTKDAFTSTTGWEVLSSVFKVYSGSVSFNASGWTTITLDTPYEYDGAKNICIGVVDNTGSYLSSDNYPYFLTYSTSANRAMRVYNDDNAYSVGTSQQISSYTGTYVQNNNQIKFTKVLKNNQSLAVSPEEINDFNYIAGDGPSEAKAVSIVGADLNSNIVVTAPTNFEVSTTVDGTYSQSLTIPYVAPSKGRGTRTVTNWGFEGTTENWTAIDSDADGYGWVLGSATSGVYLEEGSNVTDQVTGHNGTADMMVSGSWTDATTSVLNPDNWLVSPQVELGGSFSLWARPFYTTYFPEHFGIYVSTTSNTNVNSFTMLGEWTLGAEDYKQYSVDLHAYQGQSGYIAVRHFNCSDNFCILVDDFQLDTDAAYNPEFPVTITSATVYVRMQDGLNPDEYTGNMTLVSGTQNKTVSLSGEVYPGTGEQYTITVNASPAEGGTVAGGGTYYEGSHRNITATPATHYTFTGWQLNGSIVSTDNPYNIEVTGDATYTAIFTEEEEYTITINQAIGGTITADLATAYAGDVVTLTLTTDSGYFLDEWNVVDANSQTVTVTNNQFTMPASDVTVTAVYTQGFEVTLNQTANGTISASQTTNLAPGTVVTLTATPDNGCVFLAWYAYKTGNPRDLVAVISNQYILMPASDVTVQAIFVTEEEYGASLGSGTNTNQYIPTYVRARYSLTQQIYLASELNNQKGRITKIAYRATTTAATRNLTIYMAHTDLSSFSSTTGWETMGSVAKVFEGNVAFSTSDWTTITLDTPFEYDGTSNINICVVDNTNSTAGSNNRYTQFYRYSGTNRALYANGTSSYANTVGYSNQLSSTTGTRISYVSQMHITMMVPGSAESLTLSPGEMADLSYVENHGPSHTNKLDIVGVDLQNNITLNAPTNFEISLTEDGTYASSLTVQRETGSKGNRIDVRTVTSWGFEDGLDGWTTIDANNDGYGWVLGSACGGVYLEEGSSLTEGHTGSGLVVSGSYSNVSGSAITPDNWLISPQINELGGSFSMWAKAQQAAYPAEHFGIYVSTTGTNPSDFTLLDEWTLTSANWKQFSVDLGLYTGRTGYIAVRHFNCSDQFMILVDDFELDTDASITIEMPVTITPATVYVRMKENLNPGNYSGTLTGAAGTFNGSVRLSGEVIAEYDITVAANPAEGGNVRGTGSYAAGTEISVIAAANAHYNFVNWTENGNPVSTDAEYTFTVSADRDLVANFELDTFVIAVEANPTEGGTITGTGTYSYGATATLTATPAEGYRFVNWTEDNVEVSTSVTYSFTVEADRDLVANFELATVDQEIELAEGWNWFVPTVDMTLAELEAALGENGIIIKSQDGKFAGYDAEEEEWSGNLRTLIPGHMYRIQVADDCSFTLNGSAVSGVTFTIEEGTNWFGFTGAQSMSVNQALRNFEPANGDMIKSQDGKFTGYDEEEEGWSGSLRNLVPGEGYIYISQDEETKVLSFPESK